MRFPARLMTVLLVSVLASAVLSSGGVAAGSPVSHRFTVFALPVHAQFINHADDRIRGMSANPFTPAEQALVIVANGTEKKAGPFAGDDVLYTFSLRSSATGAKNSGSALFTCYFAFSKHATCEAYFELEHGLILASGQIAFGGSRFTLAVIGGTGAYLGARGQLSASPASRPQSAERLDIELVGA